MPPTAAPALNPDLPELITGRPASKETARVACLLHEPRALVRAGLEYALRDAWPEADLRTEAQGDCDLVIASLSGDSSEGVTRTLGELARRFPDAPIVTLCDTVAASTVALATRFGVAALIPTSTNIQIAVGILKLVLAGGTYMPHHASAGGTTAKPPGADLSVAGQMPRFEAFTPRELELLRRLKDGKPNKIIAWELGICESTAKVHMRHIMRKLNATNRTQAALLASKMFDQEPS